MNAIAKLIRADETRRTRFHTGNGHLCLYPVEFFKAFATTMARIGADKYSPSPWLVYSATSYLTPMVSGKRVFEFGSGMSTSWFAERCRELISVESNPEWYASTVARTSGRGNVRVIYAESQADYVTAICQDAGKFDVVLIDGLYRTECVKLVRSCLNPKALVVVDNTDVDPDLSSTINRVFADSYIRTFRGWAPGILHPNETTIIENIPL